MLRKLHKKFIVPIIVSFLVFPITSCQKQSLLWLGTPRARQSVPLHLLSKMRMLNMTEDSPVLLRIFKKENTLEVWKQTQSGEYALLTSYKICAWSGKLGPKYMTYDRQAPEGFYQLDTSHMNAFSHYYLALNVGFPNAYDASYGRRGANIMIHGGCSSSGCYAMTDRNIAEIYALVRDAFLGGQETVQIQAFPFHMTAKNMALYRNDPNYSFWDNLRAGYAIFDLTHTPVSYRVSNGQYVFDLPENYAPYDEDYIKEFGYYADKYIKPPRISNPKLRGITGEGEAIKVAKWMMKAIQGQQSSDIPPNLRR